MVEMEVVVGVAGAVLVVLAQTAQVVKAGV
jgi:hypothetical protein